MKSEKGVASPPLIDAMESLPQSEIKTDDSLSQNTSNLLSTGAGNPHIDTSMSSLDGSAPLNGEVKQTLISGAPQLPRADSSVPPLHPLHQVSPTGPPPQNMQQSQTVGQVTGGGDPNGNVPGSVGNVSEFELARRLGVRFDSSNAAWVARWTDTQNDRKKSRWFSIAKYGNSSARRLAIQACLSNMKPSDFPSLRDLQDVLTTFAASPPTGGPNGGGPGYLVPGGDVGASPNMAGVVRGTGVDHHAMAGMGKMGPQFGHHHSMLHPHHHHNPFALSGLANPAMANYMAAAAGQMPPGIALAHPGAASALGILCQGVPQHQAMQSMAPQQLDGTGQPEDNMEHPHGQPDTDVNGRQVVKRQFDGVNPQDGTMNDSSIVVKAPYDQTTTASSSVASPAATTGVKMEGGSPRSMAVRSSDPAFLQSLSANALPTTPPESASSSSSRFILSGGSSSQDSSDLETRSVCSRSDEDDDDDEDDEGKEGEDGERTTKRKKRKLDEQGNATNTGAAMQPQANNQSGAFGMNVYNQQNQGNIHNAIAAAAAAAGHMHPSYYSIYSGYPHTQQMLLHQMGPGAAAGQAGLHGLPFMLQPSMMPMLHPHFQHAAAAAAGFLPHGLQGGMDLQGAQGGQFHHMMKPTSPNTGLYLPPGNRFGLSTTVGPQDLNVLACMYALSSDSPQSQSAGDSPSSATSPNGDNGAPGGAGSSVPYKRHHGHSGSQSSSSSNGAGGGAGSASAKMTCERGLHYSKCYQGNQECWIAVWNTKGGRIMHEAFDVTEMGFEGAKQKAREARDAAHSNNVAVTENSRPSWKSHSNTGIPHVSLDSQQLRFRAHKFGRRLCRSFSFGRRRGSYASRESAFDAAVLWLIQTPTDEEIAAVSGCSSKIEE